MTLKEALRNLVGSSDLVAAVRDIFSYIHQRFTANNITFQVLGAPNEGYLKTYRFTKGSGQTAETWDIDIPKDLVVTSGSLATITEGTGANAGKFYDGAMEVLTVNAAGSYLKLMIANQAQPVYINTTDLVDVYTAQQNASKVQLYVLNGVISAAIVVGSIEKTDLVAAVQTSLDHGDTAHGWGDHAQAGYLTEGKLKDIATITDSTKVSRILVIGTDGKAYAIAP